MAAHNPIITRSYFQRRERARARERIRKRQVKYWDLANVFSLPYLLFSKVFSQSSIPLSNTRTNTFTQTFTSTNSSLKVSGTYTKNVRMTRTFQFYVEQSQAS